MVRRDDEDEERKVTNTKGSNDALMVVFTSAQSPNFVCVHCVCVHGNMIIIITIMIHSQFTYPLCEMIIIIVIIIWLLLVCYE